MMEKNKRIPILIGLLALLVLIAYATGTFDRAPSTVDVPTIEIEAGAIDQIELKKSEFTIRVQKVSGLWQVMEPIAWIADYVSIKSFTASLAELKLESVVSRNPERYGRYGVDSTASVLTLTSGDKIQKMTVASKGSDFGQWSQCHFPTSRSSCSTAGLLAKPPQFGPFLTAMR